MAETGVHGGSAHDAVWWVVLHQGAMDYARSVGGPDGDTRLLPRPGVVARDHGADRPTTVGRAGVTVPTRGGRRGA